MRILFYRKATRLKRQEKECHCFCISIAGNEKIKERKKHYVFILTFSFCLDRSDKKYRTNCARTVSDMYKKLDIAFSPYTHVQYITIYVEVVDFVLNCIC